jgi:hypothetical protein
MVWRKASSSYDDGDQSGDLSDLNWTKMSSGAVNGMSGEMAGFA